jgi:[ribosomal protein S18]-alanine N-acetyltransferase
MTASDARAVLAWRYDGPYAFYDIAVEDGDAAVREMLDGSQWAVDDEQGSLVGFLAFGQSAQVPGGHTAGVYERYPGLDIGLGMRPDATGKGLGLSFVRACVDHVRRELGVEDLRLSVTTFNERAIRVYDRAGFQRGPVFRSSTPAGATEFLLMTLGPDICDGQAE